MTYCTTTYTVGLVKSTDEDFLSMTCAVVFLVIQDRGFFSIFQDCQYAIGLPIRDGSPPPPSVLQDEDFRSPSAVGAPPNGRGKDLLKLALITFGLKTTNIS